MLIIEKSDNKDKQKKINPNFKCVKGLNSHEFLWRSESE